MNKQKYILILITGICCAVAGCYFLFTTDNGRTDTQKISQMILTAIGAFIGTYAILRLFFNKRFEASHNRGLMIITSGMIASSVIIGGFHLGLSFIQIREIAAKPVRIRAVINDAFERGKKKEPYKEYTFKVNGKTYYGSFRDPSLFIRVGDSVNVTYAADHPQFNQAEVDYIYQ